LGGVEVAFECMTTAPGDGHTNGTHGDSPPEKSAWLVMGGESSHVRSHVKASSDGISHVSVPRKIFFLDSIADIPQYPEKICIISGGRSNLLSRGEQHGTPLPQSHLGSPWSCRGDV
jgi:hypothetical protein